MALSLKVNKTPLKIIAFQDPSVRCSRESYEKYLDTLDEAILNLDSAAAPTRFILKRSLDVSEIQEVKKSMADVEGNKMKVNLGYMMVEIKYALVGIEDAGEGLAYQVDTEKGGTSDQLIALLEEAGVLSDLYRARQSAISSKKGAAAPKTN